MWSFEQDILGEDLTDGGMRLTSRRPRGKRCALYANPKIPNLNFHKHRRPRWRFQSYKKGQGFQHYDQRDRRNQQAIIRGQEVRKGREGILVA